MKALSRRRRARSLRDRDPKALALVTVPLVAVLLISVYAFGALGLGTRGYTVSGVFASSGGLQTGSQVQLAGVQVGRVTAIRPDFAHGHVIVEWKVDGGIELGPRTRADIRLANLLGGQYVKLSGPVAEPYLESLPEARRRIPLERTSIPYTLNKTLDSATGLAGGLDTKAIDRLLAEASRVELPSRRELQDLLADLGKVGKTLNDDFPKIAAIIANGEKLTGTLSAKDQQLGQLLEYGRTLLAELARRKERLAAALGDGSTVVKNLSELLDTRQAQLQKVLDGLHLTTEALTGDNLASLNVTFAWFGPAFFGLGLAGNHDGRWTEGGFVGFGPLQPGLFGPQPNFNPPNFPLVPTGEVQ
ncbi:MlaD family protein [Actinocorallia sp. A-T 12471]|uniref:MlaD family protein n=1 Tax=Actinocorallia sp. A-T 12471 TaxID=3089813 RepID=UPI0029CB89A5|nr:MlaD family protein [Actinocorallia sp. A-T 12471]MDX6741478.1 MlaD family protein [Actinocorallia sp. A-T 12471]